MLYNKLLENIILPAGDYFIGNSFIKQLKELREITKLKEEQIQQLQLKKLADILNYGISNSEYYKSLNTLKESDPVKWLKQFPILDKTILREKQEEILTSPAKELIRQCSSGSTGTQSVVFWTKHEQSVHRATQILWWEWAGYKMGLPLLQTGINPKRTFVKKTKDHLFRTNYIQAFAHDEQQVKLALAWAKRKNSPILAGYASSLYVIANFAKEKNIDIQFKSAVCWGDKLFDHYRNLIHDVFNCPVYETYGSGEGLMIGGQYDQPYMYIMLPNIFLEIVDDEGNEVPDGQLGHVIVTNLNGYAMPLIRYRLGDLAIKLPRAQYPERRALGLPLLQKVIGRDTDLIKTRSGKYMVVHSFTGIFEHIPQIKQFCVIQDHLDGMTIEYIPSVDFSPDILDKIKFKIQEYLKEPFEVIFREVRVIPPTKSGKPQIIISRLPKITI